MLKPDDITDEPESFLEVLDGMIESTEEFIRDDEVTPDNDPEGRLDDLKVLNHVRGLYTGFFQGEN